MMLNGDLWFVWLFPKWKVMAKWVPGIRLISNKIIQFLHIFSNHWINWKKKSHFDLIRYGNKTHSYHTVQEIASLEYLGQIKSLYS